MIATSLLIAVSIVQPPAAPRTVNDIVIGNAADFAVRGPGRICLRRTSVDLLPGATGYLDYRGIHIGAVRVEGPHGHFLVREAENWNRPTAEFRLLRSGPSLEVERHRRDGRSTYLFYGKAEYGPTRDGLRPVVWLVGDALNGSTRDDRIFRRIDVNLKDPASCARQFDYGWEFILGPSPDPEPDAAQEQSDER